MHRESVQQTPDTVAWIMEIKAICQELENKIAKVNTKSVCAMNYSTFLSPTLLSQKRWGMNKASLPITLEACLRDDNLHTQIRVQ